MTPNKLPPLPELIEKIIAGCATYTVVNPNGSRLKEVTVKESVWNEFLQAAESIRQSQSLPAGAVAGLAAQLRQMACWCKSSEDDDGTGTFIPAYASGDVFDILTQAALQADAREKGEAVSEWETVTPKREHSHIRCAKYPDLMAYHEGVSGDGPHAYNWSDKPHRLVYDLTAMVSELRDRLATQPAQASEEVAVTTSEPVSFDIPDGAIWNAKTNTWGAP